LIVDDEKNIRLTLAQTLKPMGYEIKTAINGEDALKQLGQDGADLILLDLSMPGMSGIEVLHRVVEKHPAARVIIITAHGTVENAVEAMKLGAIDFIQKPFSPPEIRDLVTKVFNRQELAEIPAPTDYATCLELVHQAINRRAFSLALDYVKQAINLDLGRPEGFNLLGALYDIQGKHPTASPSILIRPITPPGRI
jgi:DNA-binding NtrC family response regulator